MGRSVDPPQWLSTRELARRLGWKNGRRFNVSDFTKLMQRVRDRKGVLEARQMGHITPPRWLVHDWESLRAQIASIVLAPEELCFRMIVLRDGSMANCHLTKYHEGACAREAT